ncbi:hypothetical protein K5N54_002675 [Vibrio vulnificus]|nr:hypothetical protein [Vibrio vulnificus]HDM8219676.1 hypothetical protein [Vibrio campbellii]
MTTKNFYFDFYSCETQTSQVNGLPLDTTGVFRQLHELFEQGREGIVKTINNQLIELRDIRATEYGFKGVIGKHRRNNLPHAAVAGGAERPLPLRENENLLEKTHFTYYSDYSLIIVQRNRLCINWQSLGMYLSPANYTTVLNPIIEPANLAWLADGHVQVKSAKINVARPTNPEVYRNVRHDFNNSIIAALNNTRSASMNLVFRGDARSDDPVERYLDSSFKRALRELQETLEVKKLDLVTEHDQTGVEHPIDLVTDRLTHYDLVELNGRYPDSFNMWEKLEEAREAKGAELVNFFGEPANRLA